MIPRPEWRVLAYVAIYLGIAAYTLANGLVASQVAYDAGDLSAFAWTAYLPLVLIVILFESAGYAFLIGVLVEAFLGLAWYGGFRWFS